MEASASPHIRVLSLCHGKIDLAGCLSEEMSQIVPKAAKNAPHPSGARSAVLSLDAAVLCPELAELAQGLYQRTGMCGRSGGEP